MNTEIEARGHLIGGQWIAGEGPPLVSTSPSDGSVVWQGRAADVHQIERAGDAARRALPDWCERPLGERIELVRRFSQLVRERGDELARLISHETGKPLWDSRTEVAAVVGKADLSIDALRTRRDTTTLTIDDYRAVTRYRPLGVVAVLGPFNFPAHLPNGHITPALLAGNVVVFKPSEQAPATGQWMVERWLDAGLPPGVINVVQGERATGQALATCPALDGLFFTGSSAAGRWLCRTFAEWPHKLLALEMGGNNPLVVHEVDDVRAAAYAIALSAYISAGQRCTCARRLVLVDGDEARQIVEAVIDLASRLRVGLWIDQPEPFLGTMISTDAARRIVAAQEELQRAGGRALLPLKIVKGRPALASPGLIDVTEIRERSDEELFGPLLQVIRVRDFESALAEANRTAYGLAAGLISQSQDHYDRFARTIRAGVVNWNRQTTGASGRLPFGGCGLSGNFRPSGYFAADYCNWPVAALESTAVQLPAQRPPGIEL